ncbi:MAG: alpha-L-arabinofuranosidase C-terminal domain-containing protein [Bacteroidales bacterium]
MKIIRHVFILALFCLLSYSGLQAQGASDNRIVLHFEQKGPVIQPEIYGQFAEHLGRCIYGGIYVGENSAIPNTRGIRNDVIEALKEIRVPVLRWPGGCFADTYHWKDGIGPKEKRPTIINVHWGGVTEDNSFGTHEFMDLCELIGTKPYISGNLGSGTVQEMSEWVEYMTSDAVSPMTDLRKKNGREAPWKVTYFGVGNEPWGCGGEMRPEYYSDLFRQYGSYCRNYGNNQLIRIAAGPSGGDTVTTNIMMKAIGQRMQAFSIHHYTVYPNWNDKGSATQFEEKGWWETLRTTLEMESIVSAHSKVMDRYDPRKRIGLFVDEWGTWYNVEPGTNPGFLYQQNSLRDALVAAINLNIFNSHADRVKMANIAQAINVLQSMLLTKDEQMVKTPTYYVFKMYTVHQGASLVPLSLQCKSEKVGGTEVPLIHASASTSQDGKTHITLCNLSPGEVQNVSIETGDKKFRSASSEIITGARINAYNDFGKPEEVGLKAYKSFNPEGNSFKISIPAHAVLCITLEE